jgi:putative transposase
MSKFRDIKTLRKFASIKASIHNHFNHERHLISRGDFKVKGEAAFFEWQRLSTV